LEAPVGRWGPHPDVVVVVARVVVVIVVSASVIIGVSVIDDD